MSILNVRLLGPTALVAVDTMGQRTVGSEHLSCVASKMVILPHAGMILTGVGRLDTITTVFCFLHHYGGTFDEIAVKFEDLVKEAGGFQSITDAPEIRGERLQMGQTIVLVGWSDSKCCVAGICAERVAGETDWIFSSINGQYLYPWDPSLEDTQDPMNAERMAALCSRQVKLISHLEPGMASGGKMVLARITGLKIEVAPACDIGIAGANKKNAMEVH